MSKYIKAMEMNALKDTFGEVRDLVVLHMDGVDCITDNQVRLTLRKKNIRLQRVKNSLTRKVFGDMRIEINPTYWSGPTVLAWGASSLAELSRELDTLFKKTDKAKDKVKFKCALVEGQEIPFDKALTMPTREEAIAKVIAMALAPASRLLSQITGPAATIAGQIKSIGEEKPAAEAVPAEAQ
ncbi:MAG: 50S ribosomal protein L10 [Gemmataceae bacterium]